MTIRKVWRQVSVFLTWLVTCALGLWIVLVGRSALLAFLVNVYIGDSVVRKLRARFFDQVYFVVAGLLYLIFIFTIENYLRSGLPQRDTLRRFAKTVGVELLVLFPLDLATALLGRSGIRLLNLLLFAAELLVGAGLLVYAVRTKPKAPDFT